MIPNSIMSEQLNLRLSKDLEKLAEHFVKKYGYKNIQELVTESLRAKVYGWEFTKHTEVTQTQSKKKVYRK